MNAAERLEKLGVKVDQIVFKHFPQLEAAARRHEKQASLTITIAVKPGRETQDPEVHIGARTRVPEEPVIIKARWDGQQLQLL